MTQSLKNICTSLLIALLTASVGYLFSTLRHLEQESVAVNTKLVNMQNAINFNSSEIRKIDNTYVNKEDYRYETQEIKNTVDKIYDLLVSKEVKRR